MSRHSRDFRGVLYPVGTVVNGLAVAIVGCAALGALFNWANSDASLSGGAAELMAAAGVTFAVGIPLVVYGRRFASERMSRREAILAVTLIWMAAGCAGALPFTLAAHLSVPDAFFEAISGLTTTGATVVTDIEGSLPRPLLLWRSVIQWLGGMGIVVLFVAVFPALGKGGKYMFKGEVPGATSEGLKPRIKETAFALWKIYLAFTACEALALFAAGLTPFDALCHALTTLSTGGFSTHDASVGAFNNPSVEYIIAGFMLLGSVNYGLFYAGLKGRSLKVFWRSSELKLFSLIVVISTLLLTIAAFQLHGGDLELAFRKALFMVGTTISSTGYGTDDYMAYPSAALQIIILLMFIGGCAGSTAGGIKVERILILARQAGAQVRKSFQPSVVQVVRLGRQVIDSHITADVASFVVIYMLCLATGGVLVSLIEGISVPAAFGAMLTCLSNMGPAPFHPGPDNFAHYSAASKLLFTLAMLLGRLEFFTLFALLLPGFWKR